MQDLLTSAEVAKLAGVGPTAVKRWADSGAIQCLKTPGGHRRFERSQVERFLTGQTDSAWQRWRESLRDSDSATAALFDRRARLGHWLAVAEDVSELLVDIGARWRSGELRVIDEHAATAVIARAIARVIDALPVAVDAPRCLLASAEGDPHTLGLSLAELCLREAGWRAQWIGSPTRGSDLVERIAEGGLAMVTLSASHGVVAADALATEAAVVGEACRGAKIALVLGGAGDWPTAPSYGARFTAYAAFVDYAKAVALETSAH